MAYITDPKGVRRDGEACIISRGSNNNSITEKMNLHIVFVVDTTGSMGTYLAALKRSLCQVSSLLQALYPEGRDSNAADVSVIAYEDYGDGHRLLRKEVSGSYDKLRNFCKKLIPGGGGDLAEASKTAFSCLSDVVKKRNSDRDSMTIVFHYTDAPPHHRLTNPDGSNRPKERAALAKHPLGYDWCKISRRFRKNSDRVRIYTIVPEDSPAGNCGAAFHALAGELVALPVLSASEITHATMSILLQLVGQPPSDNDSSNYRRISFQRHDDAMGRLLSGDFNEDNFPELNTEACRVPGFKATPKNTLDLQWTDNHVFEALPQVETDLSVLRKAFKESAAYRDVVFESLKELLDPQNVMALTTNEVFGRMWRLVCTCREDDRLPRLQAKMGTCVSSNQLSEAELSRLRDWLENSYDNAAEINETIRSHDRCGHHYVLDAFADHSTLTVNGLRSLGRSPCPQALAVVQRMLSHIMLVDGGEGLDELPIDDEDNLRFLPESLDDYQVFTMLPHLMRAGTQYSLKPAAILAILCCKSSESLLVARAQNFLKSICGKWLPPVARIDRPEIIAYEFSSLIANCQVTGAFTDEEQNFFRRLHEIWRYRRGRNETFEVATHFSPTKPMLLPDCKEKCVKCKEWTSKTLMDESRTCGICLWMSASKDNVWERPQEGEDFFVENSESYLVECTSCNVIYAVLGPADLNVPPKCHSCRFHPKRMGSPFKRCGCCKAKWCDPSLGANDESGDFICPVCDHSGTTAPAATAPSASTSTHRLSLNEIVDANPTWVKKLGFRPRGGAIVFSSGSIYQAVANDRQVLMPRPESDNAPPLHYKGKPVLNEFNLVKNIKERISSSNFMGTCQLCYEDMVVERLRPACGHCANRCCRECLKAWYGQNSPGTLFVPSHDMCPFCRQRPRYHVLSQYNHQACGIVGQSRRKGAKLRLRADWYYGWCTGCWKVAFAMARSCADGDIPELTAFVCEECAERTQMRILAEQEADLEKRTKLMLDQAKPCPSCQILTTHLGGCSHMTCSKCHAHWCWQCGVFAADKGADVYNHLRSAHGGYGWVHDDDG